MKQIITLFLLLFSLQSYSQPNYLSYRSDSSIQRGSDNPRLRKRILRQTKPGGRLDFFTPIKDKEYEAVFVKPKVISTNLCIALYKWGSANFDLGVNTVDDALSIFQEFKGRKLNQRETDYIKMGFNKELDK